MSDFIDEEIEYRYAFLVRQQFAKEPAVDAFYEVQLPDGYTGSEADMMATLKPGWHEEEIRSDSQALFGMEMRARYNSDMYQSVCLVRCPVPLTADDLDAIIKDKHRNGTLLDFLAKSAI